MIEAQVWTLIGVLVATQAALLGGLFNLGARFDRLDTKIDAQGASLGARFDRLDAKIDAQGTSLGARIDRLDAKTDAQSSSLMALMRRFDQLDAKLDEHLRRHAG